MLLLGFVLLAGQAWAQAEPGNPVAEPPPVAAATASSAASPELESLLQNLEDDAPRAELIRALRAAAPEAETEAAPSSPSTEPALLAPNTLGAQLLQGPSQRLAAFSYHLVAEVEAIADLPVVPGVRTHLARHTTHPAAGSGSNGWTLSAWCAGPWCGVPLTRVALGEHVVLVALLMRQQRLHVKHGLRCLPPTQPPELRHDGWRGR